MNKKVAMAKLVAISVTAGAALSAVADPQRGCDVCPVEQASPEPVRISSADARRYRECDVCPTAEESARAQAGASGSSLALND